MFKAVFLKLYILNHADFLNNLKKFTFSGNSVPKLKENIALNTLAFHIQQHEDLLSNYLAQHENCLVQESNRESRGESLIEDLKLYSFFEKWFGENEGLESQFELKFFPHPPSCN